MPRQFSKTKKLLPLFLGAFFIAEIAPKAQGAFWEIWPLKKTVPEPEHKGAQTKIRFLGASAFPERKLRAAIEEQLGRIHSEGLSRPNADDAAYYCAVFYHQMGFANAEVNWKIEEDTLCLEIQEGHLAKLSATSIEGNLSIPSPRLLSLLTSVTTDRLRLPENQIPFVMDDLQMGANRILDLYQAEGFMDVQVSSPEATFSEDGTKAGVRLTVTEGTRYSFGAVHFLGNLGYSQDTLLKELAPILEKPFTPPRVTAIENTVRRFYANRAHFEATVEVLPSPLGVRDRGVVALEIRINSGPAYRIHGIESEGLVRIKKRWLENRLATLEDHPFAPDLLEKKQQDLLSSGLFDSLKITPLPQPDHTLRLHVQAREAQAKELGLSLGYGSYEGAMGGVRLANQNLFGQGILGSVELNVSQRSLALETTLSDPWLFETRTEFLTRAFIRSRVELGYEKRDAGARAELSRRLLPPLRAAVFGQIRTVEITNSQIPSPDLGPTAYQIGTVGASITLDKRDNAFNPSSGWIASFLADTNTLTKGPTFARSSGRVTWHYPLPHQVRVAASARFGVISQRSSVPIDERYFLGGATTVRSFNERELGNPSINAYPTGGSAYSLANVETDFPLWQNLRGAVFFDAGSLSPQGNEIPLSDFRCGAGAGLRYNLPVGLVRFDVGVNPDRRPSEHWGAAHFSFGFAF
jgi:outer membrane protein assembly complex protein YaeT